VPKGDTGAFSCIRSDGTTIVNVLDPPAQPWVTSVGGTSLESDNPGTNPNPSYPSAGESVWNVDNLCNTSAAEGQHPGLFWCAETGAGGGGNSQYWGRPFYQFGPGINNPYNTHGNGTTQCTLAAVGTPCREVPDVSANADEYTPYAEYCTGNANTPYSVCGTFSGSEPVPGWFGIGGTSLSSPLWSAIIADRDSYQRFRSGNVNPLLYLLYNIAPNNYFNDITGSGQTDQQQWSVPDDTGIRPCDGYRDAEDDSPHHGPHLSAAPTGVLMLELKARLARVTRQARPPWAVATARLAGVETMQHRTSHSSASDPRMLSGAIAEDKVTPCP
jgi:hypothetical protein